MRFRAAISILPLSLLLAAPAALANDAYEPNEGASTASGPVVAGKAYTAMIDGPGDDDFFAMRGSGTVTIDATVTRDTCPDGSPALNISVAAVDSYGAQYGSVARQGSTRMTVTLEQGRDYVIGFATASTSFGDPPCGDGDVDYGFVVNGALDSAPPPSATTKRLKTSPKLRAYACLHRSQAHTGFEEPTLRFILKSGGRWIDRTTAQRVTARWKWRNNLATLYSKSGRRLHTFAHFRDGSGKYLRQHPVPKNGDALICR